MKCKIFKVRFLLLLGMLFVGALPMQSQGTNLYVYENDGSKQSFSLDEVRKLTFTATELVVNKQNGETASVLFADLRCFSLQGNLYTGIPAVSGAGLDVTVYTNPAVNEVVVKNTQAIAGVSLFDLKGQKLLQLYPQSSEVTISLSSYPAGVYLLQVVDESGITTKKIIKN